MLLNVCNALHPALPHPELTPVLDFGVKLGLRLELVRDVDGKPSYILDSFRKIDDECSNVMEGIL